jgi:hypothetical protein
MRKMVSSMSHSTNVLPRFGWRRLGTIWRTVGEGKNKFTKMFGQVHGGFFTLILLVISASTPRMSVLWRPFATSFKPTTLTYRHRVVPIGCRRYIASVAPNTGEGPLAGLRVLDMTRVLAGVRWTYLAAYSARLINRVQPYCTQILGDLGYAR